MYCLNAFKSFIQRKVKSENTGMWPCKTVDANKDNTNQRILHWIAALSRAFEKGI